MEEIRKAITHMENDQPQEAVDTLEAYLPGANEEEKFTIAELYMQWGMHEEAKAVLLQLEQMFPDEMELKMMLAELFIDLNEDQEAIDKLDQIVEDEDYFVPAQMQLADLYEAQGLFEVAEQKLLAAKRFDPSEPVIDLALGELALSTASYLKAITYYEKVYEKQPVMGDIDIALRLAEAYAATGEFEKALTYYQETDVDDVEQLFSFGFTAFKLSRYDIAISTWEKLLKEEADYLSVYEYLAKAYEEEGLMEKAFETAEKGLSLDEYNQKLYFTAGRLARQLGKNDRSYFLIRHAIALDPGYKEAILYLIENFKLDEDHEAIIELLTHILETDEEDAAYRWELARAYNETEIFDEALKAYGEAYTNFKDDSDFLKEYGYFLLEEGRMQEAVEILKEYLRLEPSDIEVEENINRLLSQ
ncbi:tetratricopeptide repeat protein [Terribacillus saccharophilus]|uniref:Uncharacterized protein n=1 Tax=Terribacillus saccharophilus TaxID=361277 RepID=A0A268AD65_9BACI|nr:tetratricopeptide repeat protein [Terribacillus saccharophilus]PAD22058.1 hypothetical protein CHH64_05280 [Terribacillus saccharophilus]PAF19468.1 hypothetical protein CHH51_03090 [Terribacillus saccharophilus]PAF22477.1 hypothetical protein CHH49_07705 [Terribacillus saccharophilus]PAF38666.1 hypothetical protein CHH58_04360 [Terribacillus saccharophilus]